MRKADIIVGAVLFVVSLVTIFLVIPHQVTTVPDGNISPALLPHRGHGYYRWFVPYTCIAEYFLAGEIFAGFFFLHRQKLALYRHILRPFVPFHGSDLLPRLHFWRDIFDRSFHDLHGLPAPLGHCFEFNWSHDDNLFHALETFEYSLAVR